MQAPTEASRQRHSQIEDLLALVAGCILMALSVTFYRHAGLLTEGTTGLAFIAHYVSNWPLGAILFVVNLPFYVFSWLAMGKTFTIKTFAAVLGFSVMTEYMPSLLRLEYMQATYAAILLSGIAVIPLKAMALSLLSALALNLVIAMNHRQGRYFGC